MHDLNLKFDLGVIAHALSVRGQPARIEPILPQVR
jgi:hypothetical protein